MDKILMKNLSFYGYHGVLKEENRLGQKFFIDIELLTDLKVAGKSDDVSDTINYAAAFELVKIIVEQNKFNLIEALAETIASSILSTYSKVLEVVVKIRKPEAPVNGIFDYFGVEIRRMQNV